MTTVAKKNRKPTNVVYVDPYIWRTTKKIIFNRAKTLTNKYNYRDTGRQVLDCIIACSNLEGKSNVSILGIQQKMQEIYPGAPCSPSTIKRYIAKLKEDKIIHRQESSNWRKTTATRLCRYLVERQRAETAPVSISKIDRYCDSHANPVGDDIPSTRAAVATPTAALTPQQQEAKRWSEAQRDDVIRKIMSGEWN